MKQVAQKWLANGALLKQSNSTPQCLWQNLVTRINAKEEAVPRETAKNISAFVSSKYISLSYESMQQFSSLFIYHFCNLNWYNTVSQTVSYSPGIAMKIIIYLSTGLHNTATMKQKTGRGTAQIFDTSNDIDMSQIEFNIQDDLQNFLKNERILKLWSTSQAKRILTDRTRIFHVG